MCEVVLFSDCGIPVYHLFFGLWVGLVVCEDIVQYLFGFIDWYVGVHV
jgi:hypothetical protein